ncbi:MAG: ribonuclease HII [Desulfurococcales archaeon]|nr:ribonuclease HII [Desulfurococcales archaeon]
MCGGGRYVVGFDEAGRGSLVGEMVVAGYAIEGNRVSMLEDMGVRDSKELSPSRRRELYKRLTSIGVFQVYPVKPGAIDRRNLTTLTEEAIAEILSRLVRRGICIDRVTIDRYGAPRRLYSLLSRINYKGEVLIEEKADSKYLEVAAASIIAKHVRDERIRVLRELYGLEGSGYPSDPRTVKWVMDALSRGEKPPIVRYSWGTLEGTGFRVSKRRTLEDFM